MGPVLALSRSSSCALDDDGITRLRQCGRSACGVCSRDAHARVLSFAASPRSDDGSIQLTCVQTGGAQTLTIDASQLDAASAMPTEEAAAEKLPAGVGAFFSAAAAGMSSLFGGSLLSGHR